MSKKILLALTAIAVLIASIIIGQQASSATSMPMPMPSPSPTPAPSTDNSTDVVLGTYTIPANFQGYGAFGYLGELASNQFRFNIAPPCQNCQITSITPDLTDTSGMSVNMDTGPMLHHFVLYQQGAWDTTCPGLFPAFFMKRLFASGNERTTIPKVPGYGLTIPSGTQFATVADLMNYSPQPQTVQIRIHVTWVPGQALKSINPVWLDETGCGFSYMDVPAGQSHQSTTWTSSLSGNVIGIGGHVHENGVNIMATDVTQNKLLCDSRESQMTMDMGVASGVTMVTGMTKCIGTAPNYSVAKINVGDQIRMDSYYNTPAAEQGVMGIMIMYVGPN